MARTKLGSNAVKQLFDEVVYTASGIQTQFIVVNDENLSAEPTLVDSEIEVFDNGLEQQIGVTFDYTITVGVGPPNVTVDFTSAPLAGHLIKIRHRIYEGSS